MAYELVVGRLHGQAWAWVVVHTLAEALGQRTAAFVASLEDSGCIASVGPGEIVVAASSAFAPFAVVEDFDMHAAVAVAAAVAGTVVADTVVVVAAAAAVAGTVAVAADTVVVVAAAAVVAADTVVAADVVVVAGVDTVVVAVGVVVADVVVAAAAVMVRA